MFRLPAYLGLGVLGLALLVGSGTTQDQKEEKKATKGFLPPGFKDLNLTLEQKGKIYSVQGEYKTKYADLEKQMKTLKAAEQMEIFKVLTEDQRKKYLESKGVEAKKEKTGDAKPPEKK